MKKISSLLVFLLLIAFINGCAGKTDVEEKAAIPDEILKYREITYGEYAANYSQEAEFYHGLRFIAPTDIEGVDIIFQGIYDEEEAGSKLEDGSKSIRLQGRLGSIVEGLPDEMTEDDIVTALSENYGDTLQYSYAEGAGTAYYVGSFFFQILIDTDGNSSLDTSLQIPLYDDENISKETIVWLNWED
jgi:hypothetical protein